MTKRKLESLYLDNTTKNSSKSKSDNLRILVAASVLAIGGYYAYNHIPQEKDEPRNIDIPIIPYEWKHLTKIRIDVADWQEYSREIAEVLTEWYGKKEKELYADFFLALMAHESAYDSQAKSKTGASGLTQITGIIFEDFLQQHRKDKYVSRILAIRDAKPELMTKLPRPLFEAIMNLSENPSDEEIGKLVGILEFFIKKSWNTPGAKIDPHTSILLWMIVFDIKYDEWRANPEGIKVVFDKINQNTQDTKYALPKDYKYGPILQNIIYASYRYNGDSSATDVSGVTAQDRYVYRVMYDYKNQTAKNFLPKQKTESNKKK